MAGESPATAVDRAVRERLARLLAGPAVDEVEIHGILRRADAWEVGDPRPSGALFDDLFDDDGLPG